MTFNEIIQKMNEVELTTEYLGKYVRYEECFIYDDDENEIEIDVIGLLKEHIDEEAKLADKSYFHDGYSCWGVYSFPKHNVHIRVSGYFSSYNGTEWNEKFEEVFPVEKTIIDFVTKKPQ